MNCNLYFLELCVSGIHIYKVIIISKCNFLWWPVVILCSKYDQLSYGIISFRSIKYVGFTPKLLEWLWFRLIDLYYIFLCTLWEISFSTFLLLNCGGLRDQILQFSLMEANFKGYFFHMCVKFIQVFLWFTFGRLILGVLHTIWISPHNNLSV